MTKKLYVANLPWSTTEEEFISHFETVGKIISASIIKDKNTGRSRGFGFIEMENADEAIEQLNNTNIGERKILVSVAREKVRR